MWPWQPAVTLTFELTIHLQNLTRSSVGASEYSSQILSKLIQLFMRYRGNKVCPDERTNEQRMDGRTDERSNGTAQKHNAFASIVKLVS